MFAFDRIAFRIQVAPKRGFRCVRKARNTTAQNYYCTVNVKVTVCVIAVDPVPDVAVIVIG
jgi:hypothetical protein